MNPLLSIVVPTKNRYKYLKHLITLIESFNSTDLELLIQDNSDDNSDFLEYLNNNKFNSVKYFYENKKLSQAGNSDLAIYNSTGEYVCFIGDDDGVTKHIVDCVKWMKMNQIDALSSSLAFYMWPDCISHIDPTASLTYKPFNGYFEITDAQIELKKVMENGCVNMGKLPSVYQGIVKRTVLEKIYSIGNTYHPGPSPDMACAVALSFFVEKYVRLDFPIIITGASVHHGGGIDKLKNRIANIEDVPFLPQNAKEKWEKNIPSVWTSATVWPESAIKSLRYLNKDELIKKINFEYMLAKFLVFHFEIKEKAIKLSSNKMKLYFYVLKILFSRYFHAGIRILSRKLNLRLLDSKKMILNLNTIEDANDYLCTQYPNFKINN